MVRVPKLTGACIACLAELRIGSHATHGRAVGRAVLAICDATELPLPGDAEGPLPARQRAIYEEHEGRPLLSAYAHRVGTRRLWIWYRLRDARHVDFVAVTSTAPRSR